MLFENWKRTLKISIWIFAIFFKSITSGKINSRLSWISHGDIVWATFMLTAIRICQKISSYNAQNVRLNAHQIYHSISCWNQVLFFHFGEKKIKNQSSNYSSALCTLECRLRFSLLPVILGYRSPKCTIIQHIF